MKIPWYNVSKCDEEKSKAREESQRERSQAESLLLPKRLKTTSEWLQNSPAGYRYHPQRGPDKDQDKRGGTAGIQSNSSSAADILLQRFFILKVKLSGKDALENLKEHIAQKKFSQFTFCAMEMKLFCAICGLELQTVAFTERMI